MAVQEIARVVNLPVSADRDLAATNDERMSRHQFGDVFEQGFPVQAKLKGEVVFEAVNIRLDGRQKRQQGFRFGREIERVVNGGIAKRLDAKTITGAKENLLLFVPQRKGEHAAKVADAIRTPLFVRFQNDFGVGGGMEFLDADFLAQLNIVVDFAVEGNPVPGVVTHRLV